MIVTDFFSGFGTNFDMVSKVKALDPLQKSRQFDTILWGLIGLCKNHPLILGMVFICPNTKNEFYISVALRIWDIRVMN